MYVRTTTLHRAINSYISRTEWFVNGRISLRASQSPRATTAVYRCACNVLLVCSVTLVRNENSTTTRARFRPAVICLHRSRKKVYVLGICADEEVSSRWVTDRTLKTCDLREWVPRIGYKNVLLGALHIDHLEARRILVAPLLEIVGIICI